MLETSPIEVCKEKITAAKTKLASLSLDYAAVKEIILHHYPKYNIAEGGELIKAVWQKRKSDYDLTEIIGLISTGKLKIKKSKS